MNYRWNWGILFQEPYLGWLLSGLRWTVLVTLCACSIGLIVGTVVGVARTVPSRAANALGNGPAQRQLQRSGRVQLCGAGSGCEQQRQRRRTLLQVSY